MRYILIFAACLPGLLGKAAIAQPLPAAPDSKHSEKAPLAYPTTYGGEIATRLGTQQGSLRLFDISPNQLDKNRSRFSGQLDTKGVKFKLQW